MLGKTSSGQQLQISRRLTGDLEDQKQGQQRISVSEFRRVSMAQEDRDIELAFNLTGKNEKKAFLMLVLILVYVGNTFSSVPNPEQIHISYR